MRGQDDESRPLFLLVSINSIFNIPLNRYVIETLNEMGDVHVIDCKLPTEITPPKNVTRRVIKDFTHDAASFDAQSLAFKVSKYSYCLYQILRTTTRKNVVIYCYDLLLLKVLSPLRAILDFRGWKLVYHQYELIEISEQRHPDLQTFQPDLMVFPEVNRANYFVEHVFGKKRNPQRVCILPNTNSGDRFQIAEDTARELNAWANGRMVIGHVGRVGPDHFFNVIQHLVEQCSADDSCFLILGRPHAKLMATLQELNRRENIRVIDEVPHRELGSYYSVMDLGLILYKPVDLNFDFCAPNKLYEYWANGVPVLAHKLRGLEDIFPSEEFGRTLDLSNVSAVGNCVNQMIADKESTKISNALFRDTVSIDKFLSHFRDSIESLVH